MKKFIIRVFALFALLTLPVLLNACSSGETTPSVGQTTPAAIPPDTPESTGTPDTSEAPTTSRSDIPPAPTEPQKIGPEEAKKMLDAGGVILVDVRRADEYITGHIPGALLLPNETILEEAEEKLPDKEAVILIYCRSGNRSAQAAGKLAGLGYRHIYDFGGILDWPYETVTGS